MTNTLKRLEQILKSLFLLQQDAITYHVSIGQILGQIPEVQV